MSSGADVRLDMKLNDDPKFIDVLYCIVLCCIQLKLLCGLDPSLASCCATKNIAYWLRMYVCIYTVLCCPDRTKMSKLENTAVGVLTYSVALALTLTLTLTFDVRW